MPSEARPKLLAYYFTNPTTHHHLRDLAQRLSVDPSNLSKELRLLIQTRAQATIRRLRGTVHWNGDLHKSRLARLAE